jgi:hypothetical protein
VEIRFRLKYGVRTIIIETASPRRPSAADRADRMEDKFPLLQFETPICEGESGQFSDGRATAGANAENNQQENCNDEK